MKISIIAILILVDILFATQKISLSNEEQFIAGYLSVDKARRKLSKTEENSYLKELLRLSGISQENAIGILKRYSLDPKGWGRFIDKLNEKTDPANIKIEKENEKEDSSC